MRKIEVLLNEYAESHQTKFNKIVHYFCVPAIFFSIIGLLACVPLGPFFNQLLPDALLPYTHLGLVLVVISLIYYLRLSITLFVGMLVFCLLMLLGIRQIELINLAPLWVLMLSIFIVAWIVQFIGHNHEGKKPSFLKDVQFLMVGPAWTMSHLFEALNIKF